MSRYIDADALREKWLCLQGHDFSPSSFVYSIDNAPTVDAVPVVQCKDCLWRNDDSSTMWLPCMERKTPDDWFCADGERRTDE